MNSEQIRAGMLEAGISFNEPYSNYRTFTVDGGCFVEWGFLPQTRIMMLDEKSRTDVNVSIGVCQTVPDICNIDSYGALTYTLAGYSDMTGYSPLSDILGAAEVKRDAVVSVCLSNEDGSAYGYYLAQVCGCVALTNGQRQNRIGRLPRSNVQEDLPRLRATS
tara:strand:+ start:39 stop:527 length:489 start_codon:yes stop_codon:yes gene_type:complete